MATKLRSDQINLYNPLPYQVREMLVADRTYYVATSGSDSNDGLTAVTPFQTIQKAVDKVASIDLSIFNITIQLANGTHTGGAVINGPWVGSGTVTIKGNAATPGAVVVSATGVDAIKTSNSAAINVQDMKITTTTNGNGLLATNNAAIRFTNVNFGDCALCHIRAEDGGVITVTGTYQAVGSAQYHYNATAGVIRCQSKTVGISLSPAFSVAFAYAQLNGAVIANACTFPGTAATGKRYEVSSNGVIFTNGASTTYFPGSVAGTTASGGQYL